MGNIKDSKITQIFFDKLAGAVANERIKLYYNLYLEFEKLKMNWEQIEQIVVNSHTHKAHAKTFMYRLKIAYATKGEM